MSRNGSGSYSLPAGNPVVAGTTIDANWANPTLNDIASALTQSFSADGQTPMSGPILMTAGTASAPALAFNSETTLGMFRPLANILGFTAGGSERMRIVNGNLLIGTTTDVAGQRLRVGGDVAFTNGTETGALRLTTGFVGLGSTSNHPVSFLANNAEVLRLTAAGVIQDSVGNELGYRKVPRVTTFNGAARGACVAVSAGFTVPASTYTAGDTFSFYNDSASTITITQGSGLTLRLNGTAVTGNRTANQRALFTIWFNSATEAVIGGGGLN